MTAAEPLAQRSNPPAPSPEDACPYALVVVGSSAGGIAALHRLLAALPGDFALPILLVAHLSRTLPSRLPEVLAFKTGLRVKWAEDGEPMAGGVVYVAPPDRHLTIGRDGRLALDATPLVQWWRPAIDRLFHSAAAAYGEAAIGVVLSGTMWDGAEGLAAIGKVGGLTISQDASAEHFEMPAAAIDLGRADIVLSPAKIAAALLALTGQRSPPPPALIDRCCDWRPRP